MQGARINFLSSGCSLDFTSPVNDISCAIQNSLVNIATGKGSDLIFPLKGTDLYAQAVSGAIVDTNTAVHASSFAALDTLFFSASQNKSTDSETITAVNIAPVSITGGSLSTQVQFNTSLGNTFGVLQPLT